MLAWIRALSAACWLTAALAAQNSAPPVPVWPADNKPPVELKGQYVYFDPVAWELVVVLPGELRGEPGAPVALMRLPYPNRFDVSLRTTVALRQDGYHYSYTVQNGYRAVDPVTSWHVTLPCALPPGEVSVLERGSHCWVMQHSVAYQNLLPHIAGRGCQIICLPDEPVRPRSRASSIVVRARAAPGLTTMSAGNDPLFSLPDDFPAAVVAFQLGRLDDLSCADRHYPTIGPRFPPGTPVGTIAADFLDSVDDLIRGGYLANSPFIAECRQVFSRIAQDPSAGRARIRTPPTTELEREILQAATASLGLGAAR